MKDIKTWKTNLDNLNELIDHGAIETVANDDKKLSECSYAICLKLSDEALERIPDIWKDQIGYGNCFICDDPIFFRHNVPKDVHKVCHVCGMHIIAADNNPQIITRKDGVEELREYVKKKGN